MQRTYYIFKNGEIVFSRYEAISLQKVLGKFKVVQHFDNRTIRVDED